MQLPKMKENFGSGPRTGNTNPGTKRSDFKAGKSERENLALEINKAYARRNEDETKIDPRLEPVEATVKPRKFKR